MSRFTVLLLLTAAAAPAAAHPGHLAEQAGHAHWLALAAFGGVIAIAVAAMGRRALRRRTVAAGRPE